ncbi:MAG: ATP-dependent helicase [Brevinema sp.]
MDSLFSDSLDNKNSSQSFEELLKSVELSEQEEVFNEQFVDSSMEPIIESPQYRLQSDFLEGMNPEQKEAVLYDEGSLLVLAGAGSGKTRVITHRFAHLVQKHNLSIYNILCVTFTNKAAEEMKERIGTLLNVNPRNAWIRTFHSMCTVILREHAPKLGFTSDFTIYDSVDTKNAIKKIMERLNIDPKEHNDKAIIRMISSCKEELKSPQELEKSARGDFEHLCAEIYHEYQKILQHNQAMDFGDLIINTIRLLEQFPEVRTRYQNQWHFIMADEFQDTNNPQYHLLSLLSRNYSNVCVVGDDDQSIYAWRGARVENIRQFHKEFRAHIIRLERNYRSYANILSAANAVVQSVQGRMPKTLKAERTTGEKITLRSLGDDRQQANFVYQEIKKQKQKGRLYKDFAILYRTNAQSRVLEELMTKQNIPYRVYGGQRFFDRAEIKDILSYLRVIVNPYDAEAFDRIVNVPKRKIGSAGKQKIQTYVEDQGVSYPLACIQAEQIKGLNKQAIQQLVSLGTLVEDLKKSLERISPTNMIKILIDSIRYLEDYLIPEYGTHDAESRFDNIQELVNAIKVFEQENPESTIADFLREASLLSSVSENSNDDAISLMTIHSAKGLEFPIVFVVGLAEGILPLSRFRSQEEIDEEKRLLYVAITRAMDQLYLSYEESTLRYGELIFNEKSYFLDSIPQEILEISHSERSHRQDSFQSKSIKNTSFTSSKYQKNTIKVNPKSSHSVQNVLGTEQSKNIKTENIISLTELEISQLILHHVFGRGVVEYRSETMVRIKFDRFGTQVLMGNAVKNLKKIVE